MAEIVGTAPHPNRAAWTALQRASFRFGALYIVLYILPFPLDTVLGLFEWPNWYTDAWYWFVPWVADNILGLSEPITFFPAGSGDTTYNYVEVLVKVVLALGGSVAWGAFDRRTDYDVPLYWLRAYARFYLGTTMLSYGYAKVFPSQFPTPSLERLMTPMGNASPMGMVWRFMGISPAYSALGGWLEFIAGALVFFRRTTALGAAIAVPVLVNVVALNFCYDVPVKLFSSHLLLFALFLLIPSIDPLYRLFWHHDTVRIPQEPSPLTSYKARWAAGIAKVAWLGIAAASEIVLEVRYAIDEEPHPWAGVYNVTSFSIDGKEQPPLVTNDSQWRRVIINDYGIVTIQFMDDTMLKSPTQLDGSEKILNLMRELDPDAELSIISESPGQLSIDGESTSGTLSIRAKRLDDLQFPLLTRGFRWINEVPYNR